MQTADWKIIRQKVIEAEKLKRQQREAQAAKDHKEYLSNKEGTYQRSKNRARIKIDVQDGCVFVASDQHYYPEGPPSLAHRVSLHLAKKLKPWAIICNGDALDLACISRWPVASFVELANRPTVEAELLETVRRLDEYTALTSPKYFIWNLGNHDARFETRLAERVPEYAGVSGMTLKDRFTKWLPAWRTDFLLPDGRTELTIQHRFKGGMHAGQNNMLWSGTNFATGHDHMLKAYTVTNTNGLYWGIHAGTMSPIDSQLFTHYIEDRPTNWQEGFPILWFRGGRFVGPELVHCTPDGRAIFRGDVLEV